MLAWKCPHDAAPAPRYLADLCVPAASTDGRRQSRSAVSGALLVPWTRTFTGQRSFAEFGPRTTNYQLPAANGPPITRTVARFIQAPAQDPPVSALDNAGCSCGCRVSSWSGAVVTVGPTASSAPTVYKCPNSTRRFEAFTTDAEIIPPIRRRVALFPTAAARDFFDGDCDAVNNSLVN